MVRNFIHFILTLLILCSTSDQAENEETIPIHCSFGSYRCADNSGCVRGAGFCDYNIDCADRSDEEFSFCREFHAIKGPCTTPCELFHSSHGCTDISTICNPSYLYYPSSDQFLALCGKIVNGLEPNEEYTFHLEMTEIILSLGKYISQSNKTTLEVEGESIFEHLAVSFDSMCPPLYVNISGKCMSLFTVAKVTWAEAMHFCESISGQLAVLGEMKDYESLLNYLYNQGLTTDFWIGGRYADSKSPGTSGWKWLDEQDIRMRVQYWSLYQTPNCTTRGTSPKCYSYSLAPREQRDGFCLALDYAFHYYFTDQNCHEKRSPLCILNEE